MSEAALYPSTDKAAHEKRIQELVAALDMLRERALRGELKGLFITAISKNRKPDADDEYLTLSNCAADRLAEMYGWGMANLHKMGETLRSTVFG